jgi:acetyltransferase-like isoleucine patch superfamily enzyme
MTVTIVTPFLGANDSEAILLSWKIGVGEFIELDRVLCELETTKAVIEVQSEATGYFFSTVDAGKPVKVGQVIGIISERHDFNVNSYLENLEMGERKRVNPTKKAEILISKNKLDLSMIEKFADGRQVTEAVVRGFLANQEIRLDRIGIGKGVKVGIVGGVGGGGAMIVADTISRIGNMQAVAIYDQNSQFHGQSILGVPVVGTLDSLVKDFGAGRIDGVVIAFNRNLQERHRVYTELVELGVSFVNIIDPSADIRTDVEIGTGNIILGHVYIGACSRIGSNNFISANVALEHGNVLGTSCAFGPGVFTSGNVTIGDRVRFGTGIFAEPSLSIGDDSVIGSGQTLVANIRSGVVLTTRAKV